MFAVTGWLPNFSPPLVTLERKSCGKSGPCSPVTSSSSRATNAAIPATLWMVLTDLKLLRRDWKLGLQCLSEWFKKLDIQCYECWMMGAYRTQRRVRTKLWRLLLLTDFVSVTLACTVEALWEYFMPLQSRDILLIFLWTQRIGFLPIAGHKCCKLMWSFLLKLFGLIAPRERQAPFTKKKLLPRDEVGPATVHLQK